MKRQIRLHCATDPALLGGAILQAGDLVIDGSVRTRLRLIEDQILARGSHEIQSRRDRFSSDS